MRSAAALITSDLVWMVGVLVAALLPAWVAAKRRWIVPRLTQQELSAVEPETGRSAQARLQLALIATLLVGIGAFALLTWGAPALRTPSPWLVGLAFALLLSATLAMLGATLRVTRFYGYALLPPTGVGAAALGLTLPWAIALPAAVVLAVGLGMLVRFVQGRSPS